MANVGLVAGANQYQFKEKYDALKEADTKERLKVPNKKLSDVEAKKKELTELNTLLGSFKNDINSLIEGDAFGESKVDATGESASMTTNKGVKVSDFDINVKQLATKDAYQTNSFSSEAYGIFNDVSIVDKDNNKKMLDSTEIKIAIGKEEFTIKIDSSDSLQSLNDKILNATNENNKKLKDLVSTKVLDTGNENYRLMITSKEGGSANEVTFKTVSSEDDPNKEEFSKAALRKLGLLSAAEASQHKADMKEAEGKIKASEVVLGGNEKNIQDYKDFVSNLSGDVVLKYKDDKGNEQSFTINKATDISSLNVKEQEALYDHFKEEELKNWVSEQTKDGKDLTITYNDGKTDKTITLKDASDIANLSEEELNALTLHKEDKEINDWVNYIKNRGEELNIKSEDDKLTVSLNKNTDYSKLSLEEKKLVRDFLNDSQKDYFKNKLSYEAAKNKFDKLDEGSNHVQKAQDAIFIYEGVEISRSTNTIDDLIIGAKITLKKEGVTNFKVSDNLDSLLEHLDTFTTNYNSIVNSLATSTKFDPKTKESGILQGINEVNKLKSDLSMIITKADANGISLSNLGFELNDKGILSFKKTDFKKAYEKNPEQIKDFLQGSVKYEELKINSLEINKMPALAEGDLKINGKSINFEEDFLKKLNDGKVEQREYLNQLVEAINDAKIEGVSAKLIPIGDNGLGISIVSDGKKALELTGNESKLRELGLKEETVASVKKEQTGVFRGFKDTLDSLVGKKGSLTKYSEQLDEDKKSITEDIKQINADIEQKYDMLAKKLSSYDAILSKYDRQSQMINAMINSAFANK